MKKSFGQDVIGRLSDFATALASPEAKPRGFTRRRITLALNPVRYTPKLVKQTRALLGVSQALFAQFLGVSVKTVHSWEQGLTLPSEIARRFMDEIRRDPEHWRQRMHDAVVTR
jgi:putative transcriptional regulator